MMHCITLLQLTPRHQLAGRRHRDGDHAAAGPAPVRGGRLGGRGHQRHDGARALPRPCARIHTPYVPGGPHLHRLRDEEQEDSAEPKALDG